jgi:hypothetical protein
VLHGGPFSTRLSAPKAAACHRKVVVGSTLSMLAILLLK